MSSLETKVADSMLHRAQKIKIAGEEFTIATPVMETLILVSEHISKIPHKAFSDDEKVFGALANAKGYRPMGDAIATIILGANGLEKIVVETVQEEVEKKVLKEVEDSYLFGLFKKKRIVEVVEVTIVEKQIETTVDELSRLSKLLRYNKSNGEMLILFKKLMEGLQVGDFFVLSSILQEINLMGKATTQALGQ